MLHVTTYIHRFREVDETNFHQHIIKIITSFTVQLKIQAFSFMFHDDLKRTYFFQQTVKMIRYKTTLKIH